MAGWHPNELDGALHPNPSDITNPSQAFPPTRPPLNTAALYYGNGCDVRLRPHVLNSLISENLALVDSVGMHYNPASLINQRTAVEYVVQKGLPKYVILNHQGDPTNYYTGTLSPPLLNSYNNGMVLCVIPTNKNQSWIRIDVGDGWRPVLRNDLQELEADDWPANVPQLIGYYNGAFYMLGPVMSQIPRVLIGTIWYWVRPDGNDITGDGTENTAAKAFRTVQGAWRAVGSRFMASPSAHIGFRLGIPGTYEGFSIGPWGAQISVRGDINHRQAYRIVVSDFGSAWIAAGATGINQFNIEGVTLVLNQASHRPYGQRGLSLRTGTTCQPQNIEITLESDNWRNQPILGEWNCAMAEWTSFSIGSDIRFIGNNHNVFTILTMHSASYMGYHVGEYIRPVWYLENMRVDSGGAGVWIGKMAYAYFINRIVQSVNVTGRRYIVEDSSFIAAGGNAIPGSSPGVVGAFSTFYP